MPPITLSSYLASYLNDIQGQLKTLHCGLTCVVHEAARLSYDLAAPAGREADATTHMIAQEALKSYKEYQQKCRNIQSLKASLKDVIIDISLDPVLQSTTLKITLPQNVSETSDAFDVLAATVGEFANRIKHGFIITTGPRSVTILGTPPQPGWDAKNWFLKNCFKSGSWGWSIGCHIDNNFPILPEKSDNEVEGS